MAESSIMCLGHEVRSARKNKITKLSTSLIKVPDEDKIVLIKKGPVSVETSLKELEENYARKPEWKVIEDGGVLSTVLSVNVLGVEKVTIRILQKE